MTNPIPSYRTNKKHFAIFRKHCLYLIKLWGITGWECVFFHCPKPNCYATLTTHAVARVLEFSLATEWPHREPTTANLRLSARHETSHALTEPLCSLAQSRFVTEDELNAGVHEVTMRLLPLLP